MLELFAESGETAGWIGGAVLALGGITTLIIQLSQSSSKVKLEEFRELIDQQRKTIDRQGLELTGVRNEMTALADKHDKDMGELEHRHSECERDRVYQSARIESLEFALENANIVFRRPSGPGPGSGTHPKLPPQPEGK